METAKLYPALMLFILFFGCVGQSAAPQKSSENITAPQQNITPPIQAEPQPQPTQSELANASAYSFAKNSSTYAYDGSDLALKDSREANGTYTFTFSFNSAHSGFGNRSANDLEEMETQHSITIIVSSGKVISAVLDGVYDELDGEWIDVAKNFDLTPTDKNRSKQIAIEFVKNSEEFQQNARSGSPIWIDDFFVYKSSDTAYLITVFYETNEFHYNEFERGSISLTVNGYSAYIHNESLRTNDWIDWYSDPTTDYSKLNAHIPNPKCPSDQQIAANLTYKFCYKPSLTDGKPCSKSEDCERGACIRMSMGEFGPPAKCKDYPYGCRYWLFEGKSPVKVCLD